MREQEINRRQQVLQKKRRKRRRRQKIMRMFFCLLLMMLVIAGVVKAAGVIRQKVSAKTTGGVPFDKQVEGRPELDVQLLTVNAYSRPGTALTKVNGIVVHYTANPGTTAQQNRDYFEGLKDSKETSASSHFVIGLEGEIIQCIPTAEIAYASNDRNGDTLAIECCIPDETGQFSDATYQSLVELVAWLCGKFDLGKEDIIRHYDVTGKMCPLYYVEHEDA